jgi:hypothetical protein
MLLNSAVTKSYLASSEFGNPSIEKGMLIVASSLFQVKNTTLRSGNCEPNSRIKNELCWYKVDQLEVNTIAENI